LFVYLCDKRTLMKIILVLMLIGAFCSCAPIQSEAPEVFVKAAPEVSQPTSSIVVPVKINLTPYFKETDKTIPKRFTGREENCEGVSYSYVFQRDPISFQGQEQTMQFAIDGKYSLKINYCPKCTDLFSDKGYCITPRIHVSCGTNGEEMRKVEIQYGTKIKLGPTYRLIGTTHLQKINTIDPCEISVFQYDATSTIKKEVTKALKNLEKEIDNEIGRVDLRTEAKQAWEILANPISLGHFGYLYANPSQIGFKNLRFNGNYATANLALQLQPTVSTHSIPTKPLPLPNLTDFQQTDGFDITLDMISTYDSLSTILTKELSGKEIEIKKKKVVFEKMEIFGAADQQLSLKIQFSGKKKGTFFLIGTPVFDAQKQSFSFPDLTFDIKSKSALLKSAKWLFSDKITSILRGYSTIDLQEHLEYVQKRLEQELNTTLDHGIKLKGHIQSVSLSAIFPSASSLILRVKTTGNLSLEM
jgi:hypothetical protein